MSESNLPTGRADPDRTARAEAALGAYLDSFAPKTYWPDAKGREEAARHLITDLLHLIEPSVFPHGDEAGLPQATAPK